MRALRECHVVPERAPRRKKKRRGQDERDGIAALVGVETGEMNIHACAITSGDDRKIDATSVT